MGCTLLAFLGLLGLWYMNRPVGQFLEWLRVQSNIKGVRSVRTRGVPVEIVGPFERLLAFILVVFAGFAPATLTVILAWLGAKLAASWHRVPITPLKDPRSSIGAAKRASEDYEAGRQARAGTLSALIAGVVSVTVGVVLGLAVRCACEWEASNWNLARELGWIV
jgi:hypothetical protein